MKIIIDPYRGGIDAGKEIKGQYEKNILLNLSKKLSQQLNELQIPTELIREKDISLTDEERNSIINELKDKNDIIIQTRLSEDNEFDIIYPLRSNDNLVSYMTKELENHGIFINKYYQRRLPTNTTLDYYSVIRNTKPNETIIIEFLRDDDYDKIIEIIALSLQKYLNNKKIYIVQKGDTLYQIAKKYNISVDEIKKLNNLTSNTLSIGQKLNISGIDTNNDINSTKIYIVQKGDTLYQIAKKYNTSVDEIKKLNNLTSNTLSIGQKLKISEINTNNNSTTSDVYTVKKGDTLYQIAKKYNTSVDEIKKLNNLTSNTLNIGQKLIINSE